MICRDSNLCRPHPAWPLALLFPPRFTLPPWNRIHRKTGRFPPPNGWTRASNSAGAQSETWAKFGVRKRPAFGRSQTCLTVSTPTMPAIPTSFGTTRARPSCSHRTGVLKSHLFAKEDAGSKPHRKGFPLHRSIFRRMAMTPQPSRNNVKGARGGFIAWTNVLSS
jgi:hypothetical protein